MSSSSSTEDDDAYGEDKGETTTDANDADTEQETTLQIPPEKIVKITQNVNASNKKKDQSLATQDAKLKQFLSNADEIESIEHFTFWKDEFLKAFRKYLDPLGTATAREADEEIYLHLEKLAKVCLDVKDMVSQGNISKERCTVKGQRSINEMISQLSVLETRIVGYWPKTQEEEVVCGYTKFELAAILVRDGFRVYGLMVATRDYVESLSQGPLMDVLKSNQLSIIQFYFRCLDSFTQTMADLGMYKLMTTCVEIYKVRPRKTKKKKFDKNTGKDALSDSSDSDDVNKGRMFQKAKFKTRSIIDRGWTSGVTRTAVKTPWDPDGTLGLEKPPPKPTGYKKKRDTDDDTDNDADNEAHREAKDQESDDEEEDQIVDYIYCFDPVHEVVTKVPRAACIEEKIIYTEDPDGKEVAEGMIEEWDSKDGQMGKTELIWKLKQLLRGAAQKKVEGLVSPPSSPKKRVSQSKG
ncbi:hypothetical protein IV203_023674 [Nitzschia inconspicua]|uniref:Uncharacterized protein n=1 Tax=Nitzschia inconspicua TaxID=303405 RepID=A0A9K3KE42_9STRA|nr:hypothetical protein IV203_023674 [Nitzschia inconspicua]